jgi:hypothetical protein
MRRLLGVPPITKKYDKFSDLSGLGNFVGRVDDINWLVSEEITTGSPVGSKTYKPWDVVNRGSMAEFIYKLVGSPGAVNPNPENSKDHHVDPKTVEDQAKRFAGDKELTALKKSNPNRYYDILWLAKTGITVGYAGGNTFKPWNSVNRGSMAEFMKKTKEYIDAHPNQSPTPTPNPTTSTPTPTQSTSKTSADSVDSGLING